MSVIHLEKELQWPLDAPTLRGISCRTYRDAADGVAWLAVRNAAFAPIAPAGRPWTASDFRREWLERPWWSPERLWLAEAHEVDAPPREDAPAAPGAVVGVVGLAYRDAAGRVPVVAWLAVVPAWQRRGVGRLLLAQVERTAWDLGHRTLAVETHSAWTAATACYARCGYRPKA